MTRYAGGPGRPRHRVRQLDGLDGGHGDQRQADQLPGGDHAADRALRLGQTGVNDCLQASNTPAERDRLPVEGQIYDITDGKDAPGGFGWLSWTGSNSAGALSDSICTPNNIPFPLDGPYDSPGAYGGVIGTNPATGETWFPVDPGKSNKASMRACLDGWINSGATVLIPVYDIVTGNGNNAAYHITGVAAFVLTSREQPAVDNIQGNFVEYYAFSDIGGGAGSVHRKPATSRPSSASSK